MLRELHAELGIPEDYGAAGSPPAFAEATDLVEVGPNLVGRIQRLTPETARQWQAMVAAADDIGIQSGGWTIKWQGDTGSITEGTTILEGIEAMTAVELGGRLPVAVEVAVPVDPAGEPGLAEDLDVVVELLLAEPSAQGRAPQAPHVKST